MIKIMKKLFCRAYRRFIRPLLPIVNYVRYNGVMVDLDVRLFDRLLPQGCKPHQVDDIPDYENATIDAMKEHVRTNDHVLIVGGGWGVTATRAALEIGANGSVICYEGSEELCNKARRIIELNGVVDRVSLVHAVVSRAVHLMGTGTASSTVSPTDLPGCDVLELDCEGAEMDILPSLRIRPRIMIVETHGVYGAPSDDVKQILERMSYRIVSTELAEGRFTEFCIRNDIRVVVAKRIDGDGSPA